MDLIDMVSDIEKFNELIIDYKQLQQLYKLQQAYAMRKQIHFSFVLIKYVEGSTVSYEEYFEMIQQQLRNSDFTFAHKEKKYIILLLSISKTKEAKSFINRLKSNLNNVNIPVVACITEVASANHTLEEVLNKSEEAVLTITSPQQEPLIIGDFFTKEPTVIKVSIVENDDVSLSIFKNMFKNIDVTNSMLDIRTFKDGLAFMDSNWYRSGNSHIIVLNDILPKKNGFEVLNYLRALPNEQKYIILFISTRVSEDAQLYCYENGADAYFVRPINLRVLEIQIKNYLKRLS